MPATTKEPASRPAEYVGKPGWPVGGHGYRELIPASVIESIPAHRLRTLRRDGFIVDVQPSAPRPASENVAVPRESDRHMGLRLALDWLVEGVASRASVERAPIRAAMEAGTDVVMFGPVRVTIPREAVVLYGLALAALRECEAEEAK